MKLLIPALAALLAVALVPPAHATNQKAAHAATRNFAATLPATALTRVKLNVPIGKIRVHTAHADTVQVHVGAHPGSYEQFHFIFDWSDTGRSSQSLPRGLHLVKSISDGTLTLCLTSPDTDGCSNEAATAAGSSNKGFHIGYSSSKDSGDSHGDWKADWNITLPARLALKINLGVGDGKIEGIGGGVNADVGVGSLDAKLPRGPLKVDVGVGHIEADIGKADYGSVQLGAGIGHVAFQVNGQQVHTGRKQNHAGSKLKLQGSGTTAYHLMAGIGHVTLKLGVPGLSNPSLAASTPAASPPQASSTSAPVPVSASAPFTTPTPTSVSAPVSALAPTTAPVVTSNAG